MMPIMNKTRSYLHFNASMSFPGVSRHLRIRCVCCLTTASASSSSLAWSSTAGGLAMARIKLSRSAQWPAELRQQSSTMCDVVQELVVIKVLISRRNQLATSALSRAASVPQNESHGKSSKETIFSSIHIFFLLWTH